MPPRDRVEYHDSQGPLPPSILIRFVDGVPVVVTENPTLNGTIIGVVSRARVVICSDRHGPPTVPWTAEQIAQAMAVARSAV